MFFALNEILLVIDEKNLDRKLPGRHSTERLRKCRHAILKVGNQTAPLGFIRIGKQQEMLGRHFEPFRVLCMKDWNQHG
ncbi:MAG: hypothetical protein DMG18_11175 [Acidobacteria bacterium]|nr:MAG: hypothetical protein DMG18_11175 [Acidobacteriota bacterium]